MSDRPVAILIEDMLEGIENIVVFTKNMNYEEYQADVKTKSAVERNIEIIGEAANSLPESVCLKYDGIVWHKIISMRNRLIHGYFKVQDDIVWNVVQNFLLPLQDQLRKILSDNL